jgi:hypothetical protein
VKNKKPEIIQEILKNDYFDPNVDVKSILPVFLVPLLKKDNNR